MEILLLLIGAGAAFYAGMRVGHFRTCHYVRRNRNNPGFIRRMIVDGTIHQL